MKLYREHNIRRAHDNDSCQRQGIQGLKAAIELLHARCIQKSWGLTLSVLEGHDIPTFRGEPIDLVWTVKGRRGVKLLPLEVKADVGHDGDTLVLETVADIDRGIPGCFYASRAALFLYYFPKLELFYLVPLEQARSWFMRYRERFPLRTIASISEQGRCKAQASLVSARALASEVDGVEIYGFRTGGWQKLEFEELRQERHLAAANGRRQS